MAVSNRRPCKINHKWTIGNFSHLYNINDNENENYSAASISKVYSNSFLPQNEHLNFSIRLVPSYVDKDKPQQPSNVYLAIFIYREVSGMLDETELKCSYKISICDEDGKSIYFRVDRSDFACEDYWGFEKFVLLDYIFNKECNILINDNLFINCELEIENLNEFNFDTVMSLVKLAARPQDSFDAKITVDRHNFEWTVQNFSKLFLPKSEDYDLPFIRSDCFHSPSNDQIEFYLILQYKEQDDLQKFSEYISLYLYAESKQKDRKYIIQYRVSILAWNRQPFVSGEGQGVLEDGQQFCRGSPNFVLRDDVINPQNGLLPEDTLTISVNIERYSTNTENSETMICAATTYTLTKDIALGPIGSLFQNEATTNKPEDAILGEPGTQAVSTDKKRKSVECYSIVYNLDDKNRGLVLVLSYEKFEDKSLNRPSNRQDVRAVMKTFDKQNFNVIVEKDKTKQKTLDILKKASNNKDYSVYTCSILIILSHAKENGFCCQDGLVVPYQTMFDYFGKCPFLIGKPKLFFIQTCRKYQIDHGIVLKDDGQPGVIRSDPLMENKTSNSAIFPINADTFAFYSFNDSMISYLEPSSGSLFIQRLCSIIDKYADRADLMEICQLVGEDISNVLERGKDDGVYKEMPIIMSNMFQKIYFSDAAY